MHPHCGRESRHAHQLPHFNAFSSWSWAQMHILRFTFLFILFWMSCINKLLNFLYINPKLQVDCHDALVCPQMHSTSQLLKFTMEHAPSRFSSNTPLPAQRNILCFQFYFPFYKYFCILNTIYLKIQDLNEFPFLWLVNIQVNKPIMWKVGPSTYFGECSALVVGLSCILSIEHPNSRLLPKSYLHAKPNRVVHSSHFWLHFWIIFGCLAEEWSEWTKKWSQKWCEKWLLWILWNTNILKME